MLLSSVEINRLKHTKVVILVNCVEKFSHQPHPKYALQFQFEGNASNLDPFLIVHNGQQHDRGSERNHQAAQEQVRKIRKSKKSSRLFKRMHVKENSSKVN